MDEEKCLLIGKIVGVHGLKGDLKASVYIETLQVFGPGDSLLVRTAAGQEKTYIVESARAHKKGMLLSLKGVSTVSSAQSFVGSDLFMKKESLPDLNEGTYYWFEIIGLSVFTKDNIFVGNVTSVIPTGSNDVYVVNDPDKLNDEEILIPAIEPVVLTIDIKKKRMIVDLPEGL